LFQDIPGESSEGTGEWKAYSPEILVLKPRRLHSVQNNTDARFKPVELNLIESGATQECFGQGSVDPL
jgi:hypothetical protein